MAHTAAGLEQRMGSSSGSSRSLHRQAAPWQLPHTSSNRQQVACSNRAPARQATPSTTGAGSTSHHRSLHLACGSVQQQQQQQQHVLQHDQRSLQPAAVHGGSSSSSSGVESPSAFYTPPPPNVGSSSSSSSCGAPSGHLSALLSPRVEPAARDAPAQVRAPDNSSSNSGSQPSSSSSSSSDAAGSATARRLAVQQVHAPVNGQPPLKQQQQHLNKQRTRDAKHPNGRPAAGRQKTPTPASPLGSGSSRKQRRQKQSNSSSSSSRSHADDLAASKLLTSSIARACCWQDLEALLQQHGTRMNHIHAAALLSTTSRLVQHHQLDPQQQQAFGAFYMHALQLAFAQAQASARPRELSSMLWAVAKVGLHPGADWLASYLNEVQPQLGAMNAQDVGLLVWSLARFRLRPEPGFCAALLAATQQQCAASVDAASGAVSSSSGGGKHGRRPVLDAQGLCNVLWGLAVLELDPGRQWLDAAAAAAGVLLREGRFEPQGISVLLWALAKFNHRPGQAWLHAAAGAAAGRLYAFKPAELSMLCHALARLHYQPQQQGVRQQQQQQQDGCCDLPAGQQAVQDHPQQSPEQQDLQQQQQQEEEEDTSLLAQVQAVSWPQLQCLSFSEAANLLWALAVMGQQVSPAWTSSALQQLQATLHEADAKALATACYGLAKLRHAQAADGWWQAVWQQVPQLLGEPAAAAAADSVTPGWAADGAPSSSSSSGGSGAGAAVQAGVLQQQCALSYSQATFLWAVAKLQVRPPPAAAGSLFAASQQLLQQQAVNGAELAGVVSAVAMLALLPPHSWLQAVDACLAALLRHSCSQQQQQQQQLAGSPAARADASQSQRQQQQAQAEGQEAAGEQAAKQQVLQLITLLQQQQQQHQQQHQQEDLAEQQPGQHQQPAAALAHHSPLKHKEVFNIVFSLTRLRHVPSPAALSALQQFVQQQGAHFAAADWQQLRSLAGRQRRADRAAAAAAAEAANGSGSAGDISSSSGVSGAAGLGRVGAASADGVGNSSSAQHEDVCHHHHQPHQQQEEGGFLEHHNPKQQQQQQQLDHLHAPCFAAEHGLQGVDDELLLYGRYLHLPATAAAAAAAYPGRRSSESDGSNGGVGGSAVVGNFAGVAAARGAASASAGAAAGAVPASRRRKLLTGTAVAAAAAGRTQ